MKKSSSYKKTYLTYFILKCQSLFLQSTFFVYNFSSDFRVFIYSCSLSSQKKLHKINPKGVGS